MKTLPLGAVSLLVTLFLAVSSLAYGPTLIVEVPGQWDTWSTLPQSVPMFDAFDIGPTLIYSQPDSDFIDDEYPYSDVGIGIYGKIDEEVSLPLRNVSLSALVDDSGIVWIAKGWDDGQSTPYTAGDLIRTNLQTPFQIWAGWLGMDGTSLPVGTFLFSFCLDSTSDSMYIDLLVHDYDEDSTLTKRFGPYQLLSGTPHVFLMDGPYFPPLSGRPDYMTNPSVMIWWHDANLDSLYQLNINFGTCDESLRVDALTGFRRVDCAFPYWWIMNSEEDHVWKVMYYNTFIASVVSDIQPVLEAPQWIGLYGDGSECALWTSHSDTAGWSLNWRNINQGIQSISRRQRIVRCQIDTHCGGSSWPGYSYSSTGIDLYWTEYDSVLNVTSLFRYSENYTGVEDELPAIPNSFRLSQSWPNPFNSTTRVTLAIPQATNIKVELYNLLGQRVRIVEQGVRTAGIHNFTIHADGLASGTYFLRVSGGNNLEAIRKITLIR